MTTTFINFDGQVAAIAGERRFNLTPQFEQLPDGDPVKRFVAIMCVYARDVASGELPGPYSDAAAELFARLTLIDDDDFRARAGDTDRQLADHFRVPLEQIAAKRRDLDIPATDASTAT